MYDVLLYEVSFGDIGTCQPHEARVTIAVVVVVTGAVKMSPTAAANSRGIRNRTRPATAEWVLLLSAINQLWPNSTNNTGEP